MYAPLSLANNIAISDIKDTIPEKEYLKRMANGDTDLLVSFYYDPVFLTHRYNGKYKEFNDMLVSRWRQLYSWATGYEPDKDVLNKPNRATIKDSLMNMVVLDKWSHHKKAYLFDAEMELTLADVDHVDVSVRTLDNLPFHTFYIQFAPDGIFSSNFHGCLVDIIPFDTGYLLYFCRMTHDLATMSGRTVFVPDDDSDDAHFILDKNDVDGDHKNDPNGLRRDWEEFCFFVLNAILALCSDNVDVNETRRTGTHYSSIRPYDESEVDMAECGFMFSQLLKLNRQKVENKEDTCEMTEVVKSRKSPRPHPVKASWQHYWVGSGENKHRILKLKVEYSTGKKANVASVQKVVSA